MILFGIKPQMLAKVGRDRPHLAARPARPSVLGWGDDAALTGFLGHDQVAQHAEHAGPAWQGHDRLVRDAGDDRRAASAGGRPARRPRPRSRSTTRRWSPWRPRSRARPDVSSQMEALIDAAVHPGSRAIAHDPVIETEARRCSRNSPGCTRPSCATWLPRRAARRRPRSTSWSPVGWTVLSRPSGPPIDGPSSS